MSARDMNGFPAIGPGAKRNPRGSYNAEQGRQRKSHSESAVSFRLVFCNRSECGGHTDERRCGDES